jgi:site-specific DNA-methyltransferase (adenine-specific)
MARKASKSASSRSQRFGVVRYPEQPERIIAPGATSPVDGIVLDPGALVPLNCVYRDDAHGIWLYQGDCLEVLDAIAAKHPEGCFDMIFADPPYFLSNGGITCHAGKMVKVDKGDWDKSRGPALNHEFNTEWLRRCQRVLKPNGTIWVTGTHHVIFSVGYAMQQLGYKILNDIAWEKPNPPPNLSCRYFTHSTETVLWAAKSEKSKHVFNYKAMKAVTGKQMKTVWTMTSPGRAEKLFGRHPTQKPVALGERCLLASTSQGDFVLDPFMGAGTTGVVCLQQSRRFVGIELDIQYHLIATSRINREVIEIWLREFRVSVVVSVVGRVTSHGESETPGRVTRLYGSDQRNGRRARHPDRTHLPRDEIRLSVVRPSPAG